MSAEGWGGASDPEPASVNIRRTDTIQTESFPREPREDVTSETLQENTNIYFLFIGSCLLSEINALLWLVWCC